MSFTDTAKTAGSWLKKVVIVLFVAQLFYIFILKWVDPPITVTQLMSWVTGYGLKRDYISFQEMGTNAPFAVLCSEDQLFPDHNGFDIKSIQKALEHNSKAKTLRGGSTLSQQVAKNVFLWQDRTWVRKGLEAYFTFMIEHVWGKQRILEVYMNVAEMGRGVFGIQAAAQYYFKKPAKKLLPMEAARIAANLPNPKKYMVNPASAHINRRANWILQQMANLRNDADIQTVLSPEKKKQKYDQ
ncbi:monofunctional biosynthetic peptidoglycan transglycosylase [Dawidia soli]|uniref:Biosynthetic peptidoglycan transglycosylase n=1 Tax=Dawidia soli TaxID=2782352 RepID=A0AAP2DDJ5_9BACT|nr:monofunctional biosynthetic peptidoglycan transglycosylase [Dawidia soli]MBT1689773.1 monofunctional biosynthetic peptidoglycan transglycosylase [Dawidia soli]